MIRIRRRACESWLDPKGGLSLAMAFRDRLAARLAVADKAVFITLTYDRTPYDDARSLYRAQRDDQHVVMFMRRLAKALGVKSLAGQWCRKMEFQRGGWVHWHIVLVGYSFIPWQTVLKAWGHGDIDVQRIDDAERAVKYMCKYISKDGGLPPWLYAERPRSIKIISASPGFWLDPAMRSDSDPEPTISIQGYRPIGYSIEQCKQTSVVHDVTRDEWSTHGQDSLWLRERLRKAGIHPSHHDKGWTYYPCTYSQFERATSRNPEGGRSPGSRAAAPGDPPLGLFRTGNPDASASAPRLPDWYTDVLDALGVFRDFPLEAA